jgi:hypothetical protein
MTVEKLEGITALKIGEGERLSTLIIRFNEPMPTLVMQHVREYLDERLSGVPVLLIGPHCDLLALVKDATKAGEHVAG